MKYKFILLVLLAITAGSYATNIETPSYSPTLLNYADANDSALDPNNTYWDAVDEWESVLMYQNYLKIQFYAYDPNDPNDETFSYEVWVADRYCNAQKVCSGDATVGGAKLSVNPITSVQLNSGAIDPNYAYVDTLGAVTTEWIQVYRQNYGGDDNVSSLIFDRQTGLVAWVRIYDRSNAYLEVYAIAYGY